MNKIKCCYSSRKLYEVEKIMNLNEALDDYIKKQCLCKELNEGIYDDIEAEKKSPRLADMCKKIAEFKETARLSNYNPIYKPQAEKMLKSFLTRTKAVENTMSDEEKSMAKQAYSDLMVMLRRWETTDKLGSALGKAAKNIGDAGRL